MMRLGGLPAMLAVAALAACTSAQLPASSSPAAAQPAHDRGRNLLYLAWDQGVGVYTYPGLKKIGALGGFAGARGICANAAGDIFVPFVYGYGGTYEFPHGGQQSIAFLAYAYSYAHACSVDRKTGNVAVIGGYQGDGAYVTVYRYKPHGGWRLGKSYELPGVYVGAYCGYDDSSDLFCDGTTARSSGFSLLELANNASSFTPVTISQTITAPGQIQWDGKHLAVDDPGISPSIVYQLSVNDSSLTKVGETRLDGSVQVQQFWIDGSTIAVPDNARQCEQSVRGCVAFYRYPAGGSAVSTFPLYDAQGAALSLR